MKTQHFWTWFQNHEKSYHKLHHANPNHFLKRAKEFKTRFEMIETGIGYQLICPLYLKKKGVMTFSAFGNKEFYHDVDSDIKSSFLKVIFKPTQFHIF